MQSPPARTVFRSPDISISMKRTYTKVPSIVAVKARRDRARRIIWRSASGRLGSLVTAPASTEEDASAVSVVASLEVADSSLVVFFGGGSPSFLFLIQAPRCRSTAIFLEETLTS